MRPSECMWSGRAGRRAGTQRRQVNIDSTQSERGRGRRQKLRAYLSPTCCTRQTSGDREAQGRKNTAYRQGCRLAESRVGIWRAMLVTSNHREAWTSCDDFTSRRTACLATISHQTRCEWARCACRCPTYMRHGVCCCVLERGEGGRTLIRHSQSAGGVARRNALVVRLEGEQMNNSSKDGNPLIDVLN
jgi:hypothetical protein